jgi:hypothetical protein
VEASASVFIVKFFEASDVSGEPFALLSSELSSLRLPMLRKLLLDLRIKFKEATDVSWKLLLLSS